MGMKYSYDEEGVAFYYFIMTLVGLYVLPTTYRLFVPASQDSFKDTVKCTCPQCDVKKRRKSILKSSMTGKFAWIKHVLLILGWALFLFASVTVVQKSKASKIYDPFEVLGISPGANEKVIKRAYKVMSMKWHPDKAKSEKDKEINNLKFVEINKAYKTLTDETARKNWEEYGNPDGPTTYSLGIVLPSWLVDSKNAFFVLALYGAGFGLLIPFLVSQSWGKSKKYTKDKILQSTMAVFFQSVKQRLALPEILEIVCMAHEFHPDEFKWNSPAGKAETDRLIAHIAKATGSSDKLTKPKNLDSDSAVRVFFLLLAHLNRIELNDPKWFADQTLVVSKAAHLLSGILKIAMVREWSVTALNTITLTQFMTQACWENQIPLIQLPYFTPATAAAFAAKTKASTVRAFLELKEEDRASALQPLNLTPEQIKNMMNVARAFPDVNVLDVSFQILGQEEITPEGVITCAVKLKLARMEDAIKLDLSKESEKARKEKVDVDQFEFDEDGNMIESAKTSALVKDDPRLRRQPVHAPYFPAEKKTNWWVLLLGPDMSTFVCPPVKVTDLAGEKTVTMQFATPPRPGQISLRLLIRSDCLYGADILMDAKFTVVKESAASKVVESDWEISDSESESENPFA